MSDDCRACACDRDDKTNHGSPHTCRPATADREQRTIAILARIPASAVEYALNCAGDAEMKVWIAKDATEPETAKAFALEAFFAKLESLASVFPASVPRWEYTSENTAFTRANVLGADGWEMVGFVPNSGDGEVWFKRRVA